VSRSDHLPFDDRLTPDPERTFAACRTNYSNSGQSADFNSDSCSVRDTHLLSDISQMGLFDPLMLAYWLPLLKFAVLGCSVWLVVSAFGDIRDDSW
jgi:hypothetical protein